MSRLITFLPVFQQRLIYRLSILLDRYRKLLEGYEPDKKDTGGNGAK